MADVLTRIRKLLALSTSANEHEAAAAALAVARTLAAYRLTLGEVLATEVIERQVLRPEEPWAQVLISVVAAGCGCRVIFSGPALLIVGGVMDVDTAATLYGRLYTQIGRLARSGWRQHVADLTDPHYGVYPSLREPGAEASWRESFALGAVGVVQERLAGFTAAPPADPETEALVRLDHGRIAALARADGYIRRRWPGARKSRGRTYRLHMGALSAGKGADVG
jgi:hypothetical protein